MKRLSWRWPLLTLGLLLALWQAAILAFKVPDYLLPSPAQIIAQIPDRSSDLSHALLVTGLEALGGFALSAVVGIAVGLFFSISALVRRSLYPYVVLLQTIPIIAISPLILLWLGNGSLSVMFISFLISVPAVILNTTHGLISVEKNLLHLFAMGNANLTALLFKLRLPHALPHIFVGLKIAAGASVVGALVGETFAGSSALGAGGLGYSAVYALSQLATPYLFAVILTSSLLGLAFFALVTTLERLTVGHWSESLNTEHID
jgi:NitT/TauT family transport system permease protein